MSQEDNSVENTKKNNVATGESDQKQRTLFDYLGNKSEASLEYPPEEDADQENKAEDKASRLKEWENTCLECSQCPLHEQRTQVVFGQGPPHALMMLIGEGPGAEEDRQGLPFVGSAGQLLNNILKAINLTREEVYITNVVKCRPPGNRLPQPREINQCVRYWKNQIEIINPHIVVCLGSLSTRTLLHKDAKITRVRGTWLENDGRWFMPTFHPAALLRDAKKKKPVWEDFQKIKAYYDSLVDEVNR